MFITETETHPALHDSSLNEYSDMSYRLWEEVWMVIISKYSHMDGPEKCEKGKQCCFNIFNTNAHIYINLL